MKTQVKIMSPLRLAPQAPARAIASKLEAPQNGFQPDLLYMDSVLVSTGTNKNTDVFLPSEMWAARNSPILKPVDWEHNTGTELLGKAGLTLTGIKSVVEDNQIIGVMYNSYAATKNGAPITEEMALAEHFQIPDEFDIINQAAIYKYLYPKASAMIVKNAEAGNLFVSMEAWFSGYDYKVGNKVVARNEETAFLDRHLRANGGDGIYKDVTVGRVLRNIVFGGVGIVANPANEDSVIHSFTNASLAEKEVLHGAVASNIIGSIPGAVASNKSREVIEIMSEEKTNTAPATATVSQSDFSDVVKRLAKAEVAIEQKDAAVKAAEVEAEKLQASVDSLTAAFAKGADTLAKILGTEASVALQKTGAADFFTVLAGFVDERLKSGAELNAQLAEATQKIAELEMEKRAISREAQIEQLLAEYTDDEKKKEERKKKMAEATKTLDDEAFAAHLEDTKDLLSLAMKKKAGLNKKFGKDEDKMKEEDKAESAEASDDGITDTAILENVKAEASVSAGNEVVPANTQDKWTALAADLLGASKRS